MSFGNMPIANAFLEKSQFSTEYFFELAPGFCETCNMFQIIEQPNPEIMFHENYAFFSSTSKKMKSHFETMAMHYEKNFIKSDDPFIVEIGCNDGIFLEYFSKKGVQHVGVEPSQNVASVAQKKGIKVKNSFFNEETAIEIKKSYGKADIICASNVICHIPDLHTIARGVKYLLKDEGAFIFEDPYLLDMVEKTSYDQIYDEHVYIFSIQSVINAFKQHELDLFHVEKQDTHGGSMRYYLCHSNTQPIQDSVKHFLLKEKNKGTHLLGTYHAFKTLCEQKKNNLLILLEKLKKEGKRVVGYAATSKSTTVLNYCGINSNLLEYISDTTPIKQDKYSPGMHIPIKSYETFQQDNPDYAVLFAWNHATEIFEKERSFTEKGGKWIVFVPEVEIIE